MPIIIDRRKNPGKKNLSNRQRFLDRFKKQIREAARKHIGKRSISDTGDQEVIISGQGTDEPRFGHKQDSGDWDYVLPGNKDYVPGDHIGKPKGGDGGGRGTKGSREGGGEDEFQFLLSYDEYLDLIFEDLELPDLIRKSEKQMTSIQKQRAGFTTAGLPSNLNIERTAIAGLSRRIALKYPKMRQIRELEAELENTDDEQRRAEIQEEIRRLRVRSNSIGFLDNVDLRFNNFVPVPKPITQAVVFCIMDVSYSMSEREKTIAKKFFLLLHLFLQRRYKKIDVVFIRHHDTSEECSEEEFFTKRESGGTVVSSAYKLTRDIIKERYKTDNWNIYVAQASDGDNVGDDGKAVEEHLSPILDQAQFMAYIEIVRDLGHLQMLASLGKQQTVLWGDLSDLQENYPHLCMKQVTSEEKVLEVFRDFFVKKD
jgi:uncharacterized sporulation protein YeaH/YhbH (DUF444 family)